MKFVAISLSVFAAATAIVIGCSSSSSNGGACVPSMGASNSTACSNCGESNCGSELSSFESSCTDFFSCVSKCGCTGTCAVSCDTNLSSSACVSAEEAFGSCLNTKCASSCTSTGTTDGGSVSPDSGGGNSVTVTCLNAAKDECTAETLSGEFVGGAGSQRTSCTTSKGTIVTSCPTAKLVGCCTIAPVSGTSTDACYYTGTVATQTAACKQSGGTWSTKS